MSFAPRAVLALAVLGSVWSGTRACREPAGEPPVASRIRSVTLGPGDRVRVEWRDEPVGPGPFAIEAQAWDDGWRAAAPSEVVADRDPKGVVAMDPATPAGWAGVVDGELRVRSAAGWEVLPLPERPSEELGTCTGSWRIGPYLGPARVAFDAAGAAWFVEPIQEELNAWRQTPEGWSRYGKFHDVALYGGGYLDVTPPVPSAPAVVFDARGWPIVAWTVRDHPAEDDTTVETRHWTGSEWRDLGRLHTAEPVGELVPAPALALLPDGTLALATGGALYTRTPTAPWSRLGDVPPDAALAALPDGRLALAGTVVGADGARGLVVEAPGGRERLASWTLGPGPDAAPAFAAGPDGRLALSWWDGRLALATWDGARFQRLP